MPNNRYIGGLEEVVLLTIHSLGKDAYGVSIHDELSKAGRKISIGSLYVTLGRLENKGYIASEDKDATEERGGRVKRNFSLTGHGIKALTEADDVRRAIQRLAYRGGEALSWV